MPKYKKEKIAINNNPLYDEILKRRGQDTIRQKRTFLFTGIDFDTILVTDYLYKQNDSLHKLSQMFYGTYEFWWVIAYVNQKPTDAHYTPGDIIKIPVNPTTIVDSIGG